MSKIVGVVLSGSGVYDGSEIQEAVFALLALDEAEVEVRCFAPEKLQMHVVDHLAGQPTDGSRNVLVESARIARGRIAPLSEARAETLDALIFPGGFGVAKNLCDFAVRGPECTVDPEVAQLVTTLYALGKPLGFCCIAPALAAAVFRDMGVAGVRLTIGDEDLGAAAALRAMGAEHVPCAVDATVTDERHNVFSTPAYMYSGPRVRDVHRGIADLVQRVLART
jgi:enhancing lycopene biosynthesis protein 2